ncbi:helix-turn-helix transcriptional regulator [Peteryoungia desertarenae]|uniref:Helix-turn-helix transcriptional regulator n=1 Tax=Peteryoungia desertarenae TaxID=1813451 RepID=A0ABX6QM86_9HYPH|nr:LuxR C-terminal-related transcriptional regulator [Peteryoungia desertarenae]QLF69345.1 helix-turn-helix transcriptional regulator [Peteryoungia desertarenae]
MVQTTKAAGSVFDDAPWASGRAVTSRSDVFPKLVSLQRHLNARGFAAFRVSGASLPHKRRLQPEYENWSTGLGAGREGFLNAYEDTLLAHIETSTLPLLWSAQNDTSFIEASDFTPFVQQIEPALLSYSGIAFPVRLGAVGNGYVVFPTSGGVDLPGELILAVHSRCYKVMTDILSLEERRVSQAEALSDREIACLQLAGDGQISEEIAERLGLSVHTVNAYLGSATIKLDSVNRIQAIAKAIRLGYIT